MKAYLHGPKEGFTIKINDVMFVDGVAEVSEITRYYADYYNVKDYPPEGLNTEEVVNSVEDVEQSEVVADKDVEELLDLVSARKTILKGGEVDGYKTPEAPSKEPREFISETPEKIGPLAKKMLTLGKWGSMRKYTKDLVGYDINRKKDAIIALNKLDGIE